LSLLDNIFIILVGTTHPGNIGAAARAMKTMGLSRLRLVSPHHFPSPEATARASGADDILETAELFTDLASALADCHLVFGSSARQRSIRWQTLTPRLCAEQSLALQQPVALVFGREHSGLSNTELDLCHYLVQIPTNPEFASLNIAAAVQVLCYELRCGVDNLAHINRVPQMSPPVEAEEMQRFYTHLEQVLIEINFLNPDNPRKLMRRLQRFFNRAQPTASEMNILRGVLTGVQTTCRRHKPDHEE